MYRRPKFLEILLEIRRDMALESDYDVELFAEITRSGNRASDIERRSEARRRMVAGKIIPEMPEVSRVGEK